MDIWKVRVCGISILLMSVISLTLGLQVSITQSIYEVAQGDEVTIMCNFQPKNPVNRFIVISWTGEPDGSFDDEEISFGTFYSSDNHVDIDPLYKDKAHIQSDMNEKVSTLLLKQVTVRESRRIRCLVQIPGDAEGKTSDSTSLVVLVAPSDPVCKIKGTAEYGHNISLTCVSEEGSPAPTYQWQSYDVKNIPRPFPPKATDKDGVLSLFNVSMDTSGYYICTSANKIRSAKCNLTLSVMPPTMQIGTTAGIIGGCVAGVAVLVLLIYCCCRDKDQPEEFAMEPPVIEYHDVPKQEKQEDGSGDVRKTSIEGHIDQRERYEMTAEKDNDCNFNRRFDCADHHKDEHSGRYDDRRNIDSRGHNEDHRERSDDRKYYSNDQQNHYDDRRSQYDDLRDQYNDQQNQYDGRGDCFSDQQDRYMHDRYDSGRGHYRQNYYDDDRNRFDDRREDYDDRQSRYDNYRYRYDDHQDHYNDHRDRRERQDQYRPTDRHDH
ncbi:cell surface A33 antigen [Neoarius graeffei]|uniref:cell surface A33 antigen n=1 Tax=Neoarius graeffei TaxID=443677 RepID=UPI00298C54BC|nr:cell surface A33 antigen [Neoarius graeffei]